MRPLVLAALLGGVLGILTALGVWSLYPPSRGTTWPIPAVALGSLLVLAAAYALVARARGLRAGDWLVVGYLATVLAGTAVVVGRDALALWRALVASNTGF
ncbi:MAG TPA: hypothetical protein VFD84_20370 [Candidatus Binatia bacterium]|jgi:hypothetical protein|nr:hypothetical protein [Candidatus Binatia bacterium]